MLHLWQAAILGLVEGITEYLPISSTGHLIITVSLLGLDRTDAQREAINAYAIVIQGGAILAVLGLYRVRVLEMIRGLLGRHESGRRLAGNIIIAFLPAAVLGVLLNDHIEALLFHPVPVIAALALGGVVMIVLTPWQRRFFHDAEADETADAHTFVDIEHLTWRRALVIGLLQCVAMWPGTSRSMMTIVGGMLVGLRPRQAAEFSFLLGLPTLGGACVYAGARNIATADQNLLEVLGLGPALVGFVVATISAALAVKWLVGFLGRHGVAVFGWYRLGLAALLAALLLTGAIEMSP